MKETTNKIYQELFERYPVLEPLRKPVLQAFQTLKDTFVAGGTLFCAGNGGSAADCEHIVGELLKSFKKQRKIDEKTQKALLAWGEEGRALIANTEGALPAFSLVSQTGISTAFANDRAWETGFAQQLYDLGRPGDCLLTLSTSGNSRNCVCAAVMAKAKGIKAIALTGQGGGKLAQVCDVTVAVPERETYKVQELHLPVYHCLCAMLEEDIF